MDIRHYTRELGQGDVLLLLHGNGEDGGYFKHQLQFFGKTYHVIAIDTRGHGETPRGSAPFTIGQFAEDLKEFMDERGIAKAHILGFSDGGNIAMEFALRYPQRVDRLILNGANLNPGGVKFSVQFPIVIGYYVTSLFAGRDPEAKKKKELLGLMVKEPHVEPKRLKQLTNRTLVIAGTRDMIKESHTRLICQSLPDAQLALVEGDHFVARRNSAEFNEVAAQFLAAK